MPAAASWLTDPVVRYGLRNAFGWLRMAPLVFAIAVEFERQGDGRLLRLACFFLCIAAPIAAADLFEMEHNGRLDQVRLAGRAPLPLAAAVFAGVAGPWLLIGIVLTVGALLAGGTTPDSLIAVAALAGFTTMLAAIGTTARQKVDARISGAALIVVATAIGVIGAENLYRMTGRTATVSLAIIIEAAVIAGCLWRLPQRIARPPVSGTGTESKLVLPSRLWLLRWPGIYRGFSMSVSGLMLFPLFAPLGILVRILITERPRGEPTESAGLYLPPLFIGLIAVSLICREDAVSGRLDLVRQSSTRAATAALQMLIGLWAPFVLATLGLFGLAAALFGVSSSELLGGAFALMLLAPLPLVEGWSRLWPTTLGVPLAVGFFFLTLSGAWAGIVVASAVLWIAVSRMPDHPQRATLGGWLGVAAATAVCTVPILTTTRNPQLFLVGLGATAAFFALSPLLIDPRSNSRIDRWAQPAAIVAGVFVAVAIRSTILGAASSAVLAAALWLTARRSRQWSLSAPIFEAGFRTFVVMFGAIMGIRFDSVPPDGSTGPWPIGMLTAAIVLAAAVELLYRSSLFLSKRRA